MRTRFELRSQGSGKPLNFDGYASLFERSYAVGPFKETIDRKAFTHSLSRPDLDVVLRIEHYGLPLARTTSGTLHLSTDDVGLRAHAQLDPRNPRVQELESGYERGDLREMSFAFRVGPNGEQWSQDRTQRRILRADLHRGDVSIVTHRASRSTTSTLSRREQRAMAERLASGWFGPGLILRQDPLDPDNDGDQDLMICDNCDGTGRLFDGLACPVCRGTGYVPVTDPALDPDQDAGEMNAERALRELRPKYDAPTRQKLANQGKALPDGSYPIRDRADLKNAIAAFGRAKDPAKVKAHIIARAKALNATDLLPDKWGVTRWALALPSFEQLEAEFLMQRLTRQHRGATERDLAEKTWQRHRDAALKARLRRRFTPWGAE